MPKSFDDYVPSSKKEAWCPRCGKEAKAGGGAVLVRLMKAKTPETSTSSRFGSVTSRQITMCETCCVEVYEKLASGLDEEANGGTRSSRARKTALSSPNPTSSRKVRK